MTFSEKSIEQELKRIQASIPKALLDQVVSEILLTPTMQDVVDKALEDPDFPQEKKEELRVLKERGYFSRKKVVQNDKIAKMIDEYVSREIKKSVKAGKLPNKSQLRALKKKNGTN